MATPASSPSSLYQTGRLQEAIAALTEEVRARPADVDRRGFLAELLCVAGDLDRAEKQLEALTKVAPDRQVGVALLRQLVRAEQWRQQFHAEGRLPEFVEKPDARMELRLQASVALRNGNTAEAARLLEEMESKRVPVRGDCDGAAFTDLRDLDDLVSDSLELLTSTGKYFLVPMSRVRSIELRKPERPRDLSWRRALVEIADGPEGEVYLPAIYAADYGSGDTAYLLGRNTDWSGSEQGPVRGKGLRTLLVGEEAKTLLEVSTLRVQS